MVIIIIIINVKNEVYKNGYGRHSVTSKTAKIQCFVRFVMYCFITKVLLALHWAHSDETVHYKSNETAIILLSTKFLTQNLKSPWAVAYLTTKWTVVVDCVQEIEKAWGMVDQAHTKENEAKETIQRLKQEINNLTKLVEQTAGVSMDKEHKYMTVRLVCNSNCSNIHL